MPLSPQDAEFKTKEHESISISRLVADYSRKIDEILSTSFSTDKDKYQINLTGLKACSKHVQDVVLDNIKKEYEAAGWAVWNVQEKTSQEFCFTLEIRKK